MQEITASELAGLKARETQGPRIKRSSLEDGLLVLWFEGESDARLTFAIQNYGPFKELDAEEVANFIVSQDGGSIRWPNLGLGFTTENLVKAVLGLADDTLIAHLRRAASKSTEAKAAAARINGSKGGRPPKIKTTE